MNKEVAYIDLQKCILQGNEDDAKKVREITKEKKIFLMNLMASPGAGKTTLILDIINNLSSKYRIAVIEGDIESTVDSEKIIRYNIPAVQLRTGGGCHLEASMILEAFSKLPLDELDFIIVENIGNLVCPAEFDIGSDVNQMILSVPEGDDKAIKYPLMFLTSNSLIISKMDVIDFFDFNMERLENNVRKLNKNIQIFPLSVKKNTGVKIYYDYLKNLIEGKIF